MSTTPNKLEISEEAKIVPGWAIALGLVAFVGIQLLWNVLLPHHRPPQRLPPVGLRIFLGLVLGALVIVWMLLIGYVNRDSKRRGMNRTLWTLIAIFVPNGVGFILYFLLRSPLQVICPGCGSVDSPSFVYCPKCRYELRPKCPKCGQPSRPGDLFCAQCGADVRQPAT